MKRNLDRRVLGIAAALLSAGVFCACASNRSEPPQALDVEEIIEVSATVTAIDVAQRMVSLRRPDGEVVSVQVGEEARNLSQVKVGDRVVARYYQAIAATIEKPGEGAQSPEVALGAARSELGQRPAGVLAKQSTTRVKIDSVDTKKNVVRFYGADGLLRVLAVKRPQAQAFLRTLKPGDEVELTFTEAVAISVVPAD